MRKKLLSTLLVVSMCTCAWTSNVVSANPPTSSDQAIKDSKVKYNQLSSEILELSSKIDKLNVEVTELQTKLDNNKSEIKTTEDEISTINLQLTQAKDEIEKTQNILNGRIRSMYKSNMMTDILVYAMSSENIFDLVNRMQYVNKIVSLDKDLVEEINKKTEFLNQSAEKLKDKQGNLKTLEQSMNKDLSSLTTKKDEQTQSLNKLNAEKDAVFSVIEENEKTLIANPLSVINGGSASVAQLQDAISTLKSLIPQFNSSTVIGLANDAIASANSKIADIKAAENNNSANNNNPSNNGSQTDNGVYKATYTMEATAYANHSTTAMGLKPVREPNGISTIAVDPSVIPLGTKVLIPGYGYAIASDTGGVIKGNKIDLYMNSEAECYSWGRRKVTLHVIAYPGEW